MHDFINPDVPQTQSYKSIYELIGASEAKNTFGNHKQSIKHVDDLLLLQALPGNVDEKKSASNHLEMLNETTYITSERYHKLNKKSSDKSVIRSTSTFFYDLDSLAKRHSYHCVTDILEEKNNIQSKSNDVVKNYKSAAIVQECATQIKPKLLKTNNVKENKKKPERYFPNDALLSSEIFLRDNEKNYNSYKSPSDNLSVNGRHQKFWSYAKYRTEYTNPVTDEKKLKKKDRGKRTEDPCPCQLFSYACPCTNSKSLTELAKNSKSLTVADEITNTPQTFSKNTKCNKYKTKKNNDVTLENKRTSTIDIIDKKSIEILSSDPCKQSINDNFSREKSEIIANTMKIKGTKRLRQIVCPHCKEIIDVISTMEEEQSLKSNNSPLYRDKELTSSPAYTYEDSKDNSKMGESRDICNHAPQCELIPVCQILPTDNIYVNQNMANKTCPLKPTPKVLRITKGCRHHPPCTVVPSCQRINVLNNNCEYIPPCLHRPRCVNLPLCAPISKSVYYDEPDSRGEEDVGTTDCLHHTHHNRCMTSHHNDTIENQINRVQNTCEFLSECSPRFVLNPKLGCISPLPSPCQLSYPICKHCKSEKSCQFDFLDWNPNIVIPVKTSSSNEDVIFIRDVGCQFRNKNYSPKDSLVRDNGSCGSFNASIGKYSTNYHTLRYEDKFTIPLSGEDLSGSTGTITSTEVNSKCPAHDRQSRDSHDVHPTGFVPISSISPYVAYCNTYPTANFCLSANDNFKEKNKVSSNAFINVLKRRQNVFLVKSRNRFFRGKYKNVSKRKRKSKSNHQPSPANVSQRALFEQV